jgi:hypothetical protein
VVHANSEAALSEAKAMLEKAIVIEDERKAPTRLIDDVVG